MGNLEILQALVFEPRKAFAELAERPKYWFPLLVLIVATATISIWYSNVADLGWVTDRQLHNSVWGRGLTEEQIALQVQRAQDYRAVSTVVTGIAVLLGLPIAMLVVALYNMLVGKITGLERSYRQWYSFSCWVSLPYALAAIPAALVLATTETTQFGQEALKTLSLNSLFFHRAFGEPGFSLFSGIDLFQIATLYLSLLGVKLWSGRSWLFAGLFVGIPWVLIYGIWARFSLG